MGEHDRLEIWRIFDLIASVPDANPQSFVSHVLRRVVAYFDASGGSIFLKQADQSYTLAASSGDQRRIPWDTQISPGEGIAGIAILSKQPMLVADPAKDARLTEQGVLRKRKLSSSLILPLITKHSGCLGVICLSRRKGLENFTTRDLHSAEAITNQIALAIGNGLLYGDLKRALEQQVEVSRLRRLAEIGQMTASIAHEIRNPLTGIRSAAQMIRQAPELAEEMAAMIEEEAIKLNGLCDEFLAFARPMEIQPAPLSLDVPVRRVVTLIEDQFKTAGVELRLEIDDKVPIITGDEPRIEQVCRNLLLNALQACSHGDVVTVRITKNGKLIVEDTGSGMTEEVKNKLFTPFLTTKTYGTGLGLSMLKKIIDAHQADLHVQSKQGTGTQFEIRFNIASAA